MRNRMHFLFLFLVLSVLSTAISAEDRTDYNDALTLYKSDRDEDSLVLFGKYVEQFPDSSKADDARWYMGRILRNLDRDDEAIVQFEEVLKDEESNRFEEAAFDLGKIYYYRREYPKVLALLRFVDDLSELNSYHLKGLELRSRTYYRLAFHEKLNYRDDQSRENFEEALRGYETLEDLIADRSDLSRIRFTMAKIFNHLADMTYEPDRYDEYRQKTLQYARSALAHTDADDEDRVESLIREIEDSEAIAFDYELEALAGFDNLSADTYGAAVKESGSILFPMAGTNSFELEAFHKHDSFDFVSSNFESQKSGDHRMVQWTELVGLGLDWRTGARRRFYNKLGLDFRYQFAEDDRDNYFQAGLSEYGSYRFDKEWRLLWTGDWQWKAYPRYKSSGRKLDAFDFSFEPQLRCYAADWIEVSLLYGFGLKPYVDSKYDTPDPDVPSDSNKMKMSNSGSLVLGVTPSRLYRVEASYKFTHSKTFHYDYWVRGEPSDRYVEGYYDYVSHRISLDNRLRGGDRFEFNLGGSLSFINFLNYPSRDESRTFTGEKRRDVALGIDAEASYLFHTTKGGVELEALLSGWWDYKVSTMKYNTTFDTNYTFFGLMLGISVTSP